MSRIKQGVVLGLAAIAAMLSVGISPAVAAPMEALELPVAASIEQQRVVKKTIDFTKGEHLVQPKVARGALVYCTPQSNPVGCIRYEPTMSWTTPGCEGEAFVLQMTYVNELRRKVPVDTTHGNFTDTAFVPAAVSAGPGMYVLEFRLFPRQLQAVTGHWQGDQEDVIFSKLTLTAPVCP